MAELPEPPKTIRRLLRHPPAYDLVLVPLAVLGTFLAAFGFFEVQKPVRGTILTIAGFLAVVIGVLKSWVALAAHSAKESPRDLEACLHTLHGLLTTLADAVDKPKSDVRLKITIHKPINGGEDLLQIIEYVGGRSAGAAGRRFPATSGIIGEAFRRKKVMSAERLSDDYEAYVRELVEHWHYTEAKARQLNRDAMSWLAVPLYDVEDPDRMVVGIVFFEADCRDFFDDTRTMIAVAACNGVARFVHFRYA